MRNLGQLPEKVRQAAMAAVIGAISENPRRAGKPLKGEFMGCWSARRGEYRVVYRIMEDEDVVMIHRIQHRRHVYRSN
ncbi:MAG: type II toxin-antitoxin system RelE/ParE family toxin [Acidimicrobiaceae bacterium]|nr:type II toxin-antitoxin system RelE/ParE family toxin [Acidimicrobiaceae bacterium]MYE97460.1 type II toxin-antitoxin system RelE/ParE family toxin [Acidimicrobiaceae bacterium]MYH43639.1 type II toxin-antitoxin system RelE/ParE family toxin [Acidimicrobiaceae bacterium]MYI52810.1 type II toxin-antitoxin system RelE/ParE family toxin [Acidimicrobiaceae bacterium]MYJ80967.1 type II toxin-antitoxin system RelE/ParE family toxin [Acidimicrobiaceae bacterium]